MEKGDLARCNSKITIKMEAVCTLGAFGGAGSHDECSGVFHLVERQRRGCGEAVPSPFGGQTLVSVDKSSAQLVFSA